jgi:hypothetical protein
MGSYLARAFGIDYRSLAAFRALLGLIILSDLATRMQDLAAFYSDGGVLPRAELLARFPDQAGFSLLMASGDTTVIAVLFALAIALALAVLVGWNTRWTLPALWLMLLSIQSRNPLINYGAEDFLRIMTFWAMFLPLDGAWAVTRRHAAPGPCLSVGSVAVLAQVCVIYVFAALLKTGPEWRVDFTAVYYALGQEPLQKPFGEWLRQLPMPILQALTAGVWWVELLGWLTLFSPLWHVPLRLLGIAAIAGMHLGFHLSLDVGLFPAIGAASMVLFMPGVIWDRLLPAARARPALDQPPSPLAVLAGDARYTSAVEAARSLAQLGVRHVLPGHALAYVLITNLMSIGDVEVQMPQSLRWMDGLHLEQAWTMFAPSPARNFGWYVIPGRLRSGKEVDAYTFADAPPPWEMPRPLIEWHESMRWSRYLTGLWLSPDRSLYHGFARYLCRTWNEGFPEEMQLKQLSINYVSTVSPWPGEPEKPERHALLDWSCDTGALTH